MSVNSFYPTLNLRDQLGPDMHTDLVQPGFGIFRATATGNFKIGSYLDHWRRSIFDRAQTP